MFGHHYKCVQLESSLAAITVERLKEYGTTKVVPFPSFILPAVCRFGILMRERPMALELKLRIKSMKLFPVSRRRRSNFEVVPGELAVILECCETALAPERFGGGRERHFKSLRLWDAALCEVFSAAAASAQRSDGLFQERGHVVRLAGGLGEDKGGLRRVGGEQGDDGGGLSR